jgi:very-short-patch-repair endonuclease
MKGYGVFLIAMALGFLALLVIAKLVPRGGGSKEVPRATWPLTRNEQAMYFRLQGALPDLIVLSQVSFGALLSARATAVRNTFDRKRADFVVCEKSFKVVAIVELDDSSHDGKEARDEKRDAQLKSAGYRVLRYRGVPNIDRVQADFAPPPPPPTTLGHEGRARVDPT